METVTCMDALMSMDGRYFARSQEGGAIMSMDGRYFARSQEGGAIMSMDGRYIENAGAIFLNSWAQGAQER